MVHVANPFAAHKRFDPITVVGFLIPISLAILIGLIISMRSQPIAQPVQQTTDASGTVTATAPVNPPTAAEVSAANQAILNYCTSDLRANTSCALTPGSTSTAPGFVETGLKLSGTFAADGASPNGLALARGSDNSWAVIWVGQNCIPRDVATQNAVPASLNVCSS